MMLSLDSLGSIASSIADHFDCFENVLQLSMALETLYLAPTRFRSSEFLQWTSSGLHSSRAISNGCSGRFGGPW